MGFKYISCIILRQRIPSVEDNSESEPLPGLRFHELSHTFATPALQNGIDMKTISSMQGHYDAGFTLQRALYRIKQSVAHVVYRKIRIASRFSVGTPLVWLSPMQPRPTGVTTGPLPPNIRSFICSSWPILLLCAVSLALRKVNRSQRPEQSGFL